jgi:glutamate 5-kinase
VITRVLEGESLGTFFVPPAPRNAAGARRRWLEGSARAKGTISVDAGAATALRKRHASLLPGGITGVSGEFARGDAVAITGPDGVPFARGLAAYSAAEVAAIKGVRSNQIRARLGYVFADEVVHRNNLALLRSLETEAP